jgi:serine/threonine protein kinase
MSQNSLIGNVIGGRYRIDDLLGQGGMSAVYKGFDPNLKRVVAVKVIHPHLADDPAFIMRFEDEAAAVAQLHHPNIIQVHDFNHDDDLYFMVQEFVPGETLQQLLRRLSEAGELLPLEEAIKYTVDICEATDYAHKRGMIHRDIKPANIMLNVNGNAVLMDFGIVKITGAATHTATGAVVGTALYMSPELIRGEVPDARADIYSLGVTLFEMVSGRPPFEADSAMSLMMMHMRDPVPNMHHLRPDAPEDLIAVITKALAKDPGDRYASMAEFSTALQGVLNNLRAGIAVPPVPVPAVQESDPEATLVEGTAPVEAAERDDTVSESQVTAAAAAMGAVSASKEPAGSPAGVAPAAPPPSMGTPGSVAPPASTASSQKSEGRQIRPAIWIGAAVVILVLIAGGIGIGMSLSGDDGTSDEDKTAGTGPTAVAVADLGNEEPPTSTPTASPDPTLIAEMALALTPTVTPSPTVTPTPTVSPSPTIPAGIPFVRLNGITLDDQANYVVDYESSEFTEQLPGVHIHFFFDTVPPELAGLPQGSGEWKIYGGPWPFTLYNQFEKPQYATMMCSLVANPDHSVQPQSGTCFELPDVVLATVVNNTTCYQGPDPVFPASKSLRATQRVLVEGISPDEQWWYVTDPEDPAESCWLAENQTQITGDISLLGLVTPPPLPEGAVSSNLSVSINGISVDGQGSYVVDYATQGFTEQLPGTHLHFFFNTELPENVGMTGGGNRLMYGGPSPFTGYRTADKPPAATEMCVLVVNPDHSVILESGNCYPLP